MTTSGERCENQLRDYATNGDIFLVVPILTQSHLPEKVNPDMKKPLPISRINQTFARRNYLQKLKELSSGESKFFNILSPFFERDEFDID